MNSPLLRKTRLEISRKNLGANYRNVRKMVGLDRDVIAVVKANAYSMGLVPVSRCFAEEGCTRFAVATPEEALELRQAGFGQEILVMGTVSQRALPPLVKHDVTLSCGDMELAHALRKESARQGRSSSIHLKVDTGLGRTGFFPEKAVETAGVISGWKELQITGTYTHFATADEENLDFTRWQFQRFSQVLDELAGKGIETGLQHCCNSPATVNCPEMYLDAVRPGNLLYGLPSGFSHRKVQLLPTCALKTELLAIREVPRGFPVGYGLKFITRGPQKLGIIPIGFYDGFTRLRQNPKVLIRGRKIPIIGTICMDTAMVDLSQLPDAKVGEEVTVIGNQGGETISVQDIADELGTIVTQVLSMITQRVPRIYI